MTPMRRLYRGWQGSDGRLVKGARSFAVLAPVPHRLSGEEAAACATAGQRPAYDAQGRPAMVVRGFRLERVFRYEDTTGEALPQEQAFSYGTGDTPTGAWEALAALVERHGFQLTAEPEPNGGRGHTNYPDRIVNVDPSYPLAERVHILVHELGHIRCGHQERRTISRAQRETEAESVAFIVCTVLGLDVADPATVYAGSWTDGDAGTITAAQTAIHQGAQSLLGDLGPVKPAGSSPILNRNAIKLRQRSAGANLCRS
jgi:hypothetical protein